MKLSKGISRLVLRNSHIEEIKRRQNSLVVVFDHAKLDSLLEENISSHVVLSKTTLTIFNSLNEILKVFFADNEFKVIPFTNDVVQNWIDIEHTDVNDEKRTLAISGDYQLDDKKGWAELYLQFEKCELEFETYIPVAHY